MAAEFQETGVRAVIKDLGTFKAGANEMEQAIAGIGMQADKSKPQISGLQAAFADLESKAQKAILPLAAVSAVLIGATGSMAMTAARTEELGIVIDNMGRVAGYTKEELDRTEAEIKALGITTQGARTIMTRFIGAELDLADASKIARAAQDLAVIAMEDSSTAAMNLTYAIASMEPRILRQYGIFVNLNDVYRDTALALNKTVEELTETEKRQGFVNAVLAQAANYTGTYEAAMTTAGKQMRSFARYTEEISNVIGNYFLPYLGQAVEMATRFAKGFLGASEQAQETAASMLMYSTAVSVALTATASLILMLPKLAAAFSFVATPLGILVALLAVVAVRGLEVQMALKKAEGELLSSTKTAKQYAEKMAEARDAIFNLRKPIQTAADDVKLLVGEQQTEIDTLKWLIHYYEESGWAAAEMGEHALRGLGLTGQYAEASKPLVEAATDAIKGMAAAFGTNVLAIQENAMAYDTLKNKVISAYADISEKTRDYQTSMTRAEEDAAKNREELLLKHAEKMAWVASGDWQRTKQQQDEAHAYWEGINAQELADFDAAVTLKATRRTEDYNHEVATAQAAAAERARIEEEQRQAELVAMKAAQEERLLLLALEMISAKEIIKVSSPWGELEVSAQEYYDLVKAGLIPVSDDIRNKLGGAISFIDSSMTTANANLATGYDTLGQIIGAVIPDIMTLGTTTEEEAAAMAGALDQGLRPSIAFTTGDVQTMGTEFGLWQEAGNLATQKVGEGWAGMQPPMDAAAIKVTETEKLYVDELGVMGKQTDLTFAGIAIAVETSMGRVTTAVAGGMAKSLQKVVAYQDNFRKAGRGLVDGLIAGIEDREDEACDAMAALVRAMIRAAEEAAGSGSPSRVFMRIGQDVVAGFALGIESMKPALEAEMRTILAPSVQVMAPAMVAPSPVVIRQGSAVNYNLAANYAQVESPAGILDDLRALQMLSRARG